MSGKSFIDIRELRPGVWRLEFDYQADFIDHIKHGVPLKDRSYDEATHYWEIRGDQYLSKLEGAAVMLFSHATKLFYRDGKQVIKNLATGRESVQENLFQ